MSEQGTYIGTPESCKECGKPLMYIGDPIPDGCPKPYCDCGNSDNLQARIKELETEVSEAKAEVEALQQQLKDKWVSVEERIRQEMDIE